ncbi:hypothetical protein KCP71_24610 [Salmonella enterica subsp. enterica]|nr:hypothetical protein KCP71_24610 [Salmonella enterica subsp. enterica]
MAGPAVCWPWRCRDYRFLIMRASWALPNSFSFRPASAHFARNISRLRVFCRAGTIGSCLCWSGWRFAPRRHLYMQYWLPGCTKYGYGRRRFLLSLMP